MEVGNNKTSILIIIACTFGMAFASTESSNELVQEFRKLSLNAKGDFLSGFFGSLAFLAAIVAIILQSKELADQREELRLTRKEFGRMAKAQEMQEKLLNEQYQDLKRDAKMRAADNEFEELLQAVRQTLYTMYPKWEFGNQFSVDTDNFTTIEFEFTPNETLTDQAELENLRTKLFILVFDLEYAEENFALKTSPDRVTEYPSLTTTPINRLCYLESSLSPAKRTKLEYLGIKDIRDSLEKLRQDKWWLKSEALL